MREHIVSVQQVTNQIQVDLLELRIDLAIGCTNMVDDLFDCSRDDALIRLIL